MNLSTNGNAIRVGVISDTHNLLRPEISSVLQGVSLILHAGDVCEPHIIEELEMMAPIIAVRGNHDHGKWANKLNKIESIVIGKVLICLIHDLKDLKIDTVASGFRVIIFGHSHQALVEDRDGVLYLNPGSAGPRRFKLPVTMALLRIADDNVEADIINVLDFANQPQNN